MEGQYGWLVTKDSNLEVQQRIALVFATFLELGSVGKIIRSFRDHALTVPRRARFGDIAWRTPTASMLFGILKNPAYAGAFVYGRTRSCHAAYASGKLMTARRPMAEWKIVVRDRYPAYLDWESFERVQTMLSDNYAEYQRNKTRGAPRDGAAVLQGIAWCGQCGHKMGVEYKPANRYVCNFLQRSQGGALCQHLPADLIDARVVAAFFAAVGPAELEAWTRARDDRPQSEEALARAEAQQVERLRYQALLAERQYNRVDPDNRLIAAELERRWEMALRELRQAEEALTRHRAADNRLEELTPDERGDFLSLGPKLPELWQAPERSRADKKALLRCLIDKVVLQRAVRDLITIRIIWRGGEVSELQVKPAVHALGALSRGAEMEARLLELASQNIDDTTIADILTQEGYRSARRLYVPVRTVQIIRQRHRILRQDTSVRVPHTSGWLTIAELAARMQISRYWINRSIRNGAIRIHRDTCAKRFLFPDTGDTIAGIQALRSGMRKHLDIAQRAIE
jgi:Recombinase/Recombinase zinc beta ribbon domain